MGELELLAPCHFGLEAVAKREIANLGCQINRVEDGRVFYRGDETAVARSNIWLRTVERVLIHVGSFKAESFEELFCGIKALPWERYIPKNGKFWVTKANSIKSRLFSTSDIQSVAKKAMVDRLGEKYGISVFSEDGEAYPVRIFVIKDVVCVGIDSTGASLHKRGYRPKSGEAPISETLACALISLTPWNKDRILIDPFCGSGTFLIEAAMMAMDMAPGLNREFISEQWQWPALEKTWKEARDEAKSQIKPMVQTDLQGYDIDHRVLSVARENAGRAGVLDKIHFQERDVSALSHKKPYGFIITNPPYGERMGEKDDLFEIYKKLGDAYRGLKDWSMYVITSYENAQKALGKKADKNRKVYNGMLRAYFYQYLGAKPKWKKKS